MHIHIWFVSFLVLVYDIYIKLSEARGTFCLAFTPMKPLQSLGVNPVTCTGHSITVPAVQTTREKKKRLSHDTSICITLDKFSRMAMASAKEG